jgi:nicotinamidase-related amidase
MDRANSGTGYTQPADLMIDKYTRPDFGHIALITIDVQRDFLDDGVCAVAGTTAVVPRIGELLGAFREAQKPIIHVVRIYRENGSNVDLCRRGVVESGTPVVRPGTPGMELAHSVPPRGAAPLDSDLLLSGELQQLGEYEWAMYKPRWGAFHRTRLENHLRSVGATTAAFAGCNFPNCPRTSIYEAKRDFRVVLVEDAVSGIYARGIEELKNIGVSLMSAADLGTAISRVGNR